MAVGESGGRERVRSEPESESRDGQPCGGHKGEFSGRRAEPAGVPRGRAVCGGVRRGLRVPRGSGRRLG